MPGPSIIPAASLQQAARESADRQELVAAAASFEAIFARQLIASMRQAGLAEDALGSAGGELFRGRFDGEVAELLGARGALGIGDALVRQLAAGSSGYDGA